MSLKSLQRWPPTPLTAYLLGAASWLVARGLWEVLFGTAKKGKKGMKKQLPSYLEIMYLHPKEVGIGEEIKSIPRIDGFRMPAEWEPHGGCVDAHVEIRISLNMPISYASPPSILAMLTMFLLPRCWLLFPYRTDNWTDGAEPAQKAYAAVANAISKHGNEQVG
jgi:hypothetical protein